MKPLSAILLAVGFVLAGIGLTVPIRVILASMPATTDQSFSAFCLVFLGAIIIAVISMSEFDKK